MQMEINILVHTSVDLWKEKACSNMATVDSSATLHRMCMFWRHMLWL